MSSIVYPYIPEGKKILYVPESNEFMAEAKRVCRELSTDRSIPTGAVVVRNGKVIGRAANQSAIKNPSLLKLHKKGLCIRRMLKIKSGEKYWLCPGCASSRNHGETLSVLNALENNSKIEGADLYLFGHWWCCEPCWNSMIKGGIRNVYLLEGSEKLFNTAHPENIIGKQFDK